ncbi:DUF2309 family protein, partial [bacterium]|nr:DUF2309 family protein [bacterium]
QEFDTAFEGSGARDFRKNLKVLRGMNAETAITFMLDRMGVRGASSQTAYMQRLLSTLLGWATQFRYLEWQRQLGYPSEKATKTEELLAVRMAYDFGLFLSAQDTHPAQISTWVNSLEQPLGVQAGAYHRVHDFRVHSIFQLAFELSYQRRVATQITRNKAKAPAKPSAQMAFCIDVRSEMIRRHIEKTESSIQTIGFAGFFGVPFDYQRLDEKDAGHRLPVLLTPAFTVKERPYDEKKGEVRARLASGLTASYFRNLRKSPLSSFVFVELFGALYAEKTLRRTAQSLVRRVRGNSLPLRFDSAGTTPSQTDVITAQGESFSGNARVERALVVLQHMGLTGPFADLVFIVGHGSDTTNNA